VSAFLQELFQVGIYKRTQGRIARQVTFAAWAVGLAAGMWRLHWMLRGTTWLPQGWETALSLAIPAALLVIGFWVGYRLMNLPVFADFLIAVEAEMNKVSWPTRSELYRSSIVVLITIFALAAVLFVFDFFWNWFFTFLRILPKG